MIIRFLLYIFLFFIISSNVIAVTYKDFNVSNEEVMNKVISIIEADTNNESDETFVMNSLLSLKVTYPDEVNFRFGQIFYFGRFGVRDIKKSVEYLSIAASLNHPGSNYMLGSILVDGEYEGEGSFEMGVDYLEKASNQNVADAMFNLYALYRKGLYPKEKAIYWLDYSASIGYERSVIFSAYEKYLSARDKGSREQVIKIVDGLIGYNFKESSGERYFFIGTMYSDEKSPIFNNDLRLKYLKLSADNGYERAIVILNEYNRLKDLDGN